MSKVQEGRAKLPAVFRIVQLGSILAILSVMFTVSRGLTVFDILYALVCGLVFYGIYQRSNIARVLLVGGFAYQFVYSVLRGLKLIYWTLSNSKFENDFLFNAWLLLLLTLLFSFLFLKDSLSEESRTAFNVNEPKANEANAKQEKLACAVGVVISVIRFLF